MLAFITKKGAAGSAPPGVETEKRAFSVAVGIVVVWVATRVPFTKNFTRFTLATISY